MLCDNLKLIMRRFAVLKVHINQKQGAPGGRCLTEHIEKGVHTSCEGNPLMLSVIMLAFLMSEHCEPCWRNPGRIASTVALLPTWILAED